ncbi:hypothetical protein [Kitasatospora sp. HPMI-4]|uniref:hypothetical protein n=1 Tax=Kitasatospora sp. HPMI-4 TaxID=3448443 RepID=UPI003F1B946A
MRFKSALAFGVIGAVLATFGAAGVASASSGTAAGATATDAATLYGYTDFSGPSVVVSSDVVIPTMGLRYSDGTPVNTIGSVYNWGPDALSIYAGPVYQGPYDYLAPYTGQATFPSGFCARSCSLVFG